MGVGKTTVGLKLNEVLPKSVFLDGDWCWYANPFQVTEETREMVLNNICFMLNSFLHCSAYENVVFCWVMHEQWTIDAVISSLDTEGVDVKLISLTCSPETLEERLRKDLAKGIRTEDAIAESIARLPLYSGLQTLKIITDNKDVLQIADEIIGL